MRSHSQFHHARQQHYAVYATDSKLRIFEHGTGKLMATFARLSVYDEIFNKSPFSLDSIEYGKRTATECVIRQESAVYSGGTIDEILECFRLNIFI